MSDSSKPNGSRPSVQASFEKYAMRVEELSQGERKWLDVDAVGADLGISSHESRKLADLMEDDGWVTTQDVAGSLKLRLPKHGFDEIAKMHWPKYQRWMDKRPRLTNAIISIVAGVIGGAITLAVARFVF